MNGPDRIITSQFNQRQGEIEIRTSQGCIDGRGCAHALRSAVLRSWKVLRHRQKRGHSLEMWLKRYTIQILIVAPVPGILHVLVQKRRDTVRRSWLFVALVWIHDSICNILPRYRPQQEEIESDQTLLERAAIHKCDCFQSQVVEKWFRRLYVTISRHGALCGVINKVTTITWTLSAIRVHLTVRLYRPLTEFGPAVPKVDTERYSHNNLFCNLAY